MKIFLFRSLVALAMTGFSGQSDAQGTLAPLYLFTNGSGSITPLEDGQLLEVGQSYEMTAVPDAGFAFSSWQEVNVFVETSVFISQGGGVVTNPPQTVVCPMPTYVETPTLTFTMQPQQVLFDTNGTFAAENIGWQADFEPIPEPSETVLFASGLIAVGLLAFGQRWRSSGCCPTSVMAGVQ